MGGKHHGARVGSSILSMHIELYGGCGPIDGDVEREVDGTSAAKGDYEGAWRILVAQVEDGSLRVW